MKPRTRLSLCVAFAAVLAGCSPVSYAAGITLPASFTVPTPQGLGALGAALAAGFVLGLAVGVVARRGRRGT
jgi:hypothetical protein